MFTEPDVDQTHVRRDDAFAAPAAIEEHASEEQPAAEQSEAPETEAPETVEDPTETYEEPEEPASIRTDPPPAPRHPQPPRLPRPPPIRTARPFSPP
ncbi:hypothetical protein [Serinibacter arcticus]|uniref:hypothetical protein n=1 Tax=Serinibacter arcticus TaxID=1655435 RepID=UPI001C12039F|nr:hypothetical protein [Serinibacter arcticus]